MKISVDLKYCYGIKSLQHDFNFSEGPSIILYAPNSSMKTSLAKVFEDISQSQSPQDARYPYRNSECKIHDENGNDLNLNIIVIKPYDDSYRSERISTLVVNEDLRKKYEAAKKSIEKAKQILLTSIGDTVKTRRNTEKLMLSAFNDSSIDSSLLLSRLENDVNSISFDFSDINYQEVINDKTEKFLKTADVHSLFKDYLEKYNEIISKSNYFRKNGFNPYNANEVSKTLNNNRYFSANHSILLTDSSGKPVPVKSSSDLNKIISEENNKVLNNPELKQKFSSIQAVVDRTVEMRKFYEYVIKNEKIIPELADIDAFKKKLWISYLVLYKDLYNDFLSAFKRGKQEIEQITSTAKQQETRWQKVVDIFKERFFVPFEVNITNQVEVILNDITPKFNFNFVDGEDSCVLEEDNLPDTLSTGEQRALYLLNIIYEIRALEAESNKSILIIDDIADSFDYKNKFAIIEYLKDISESGKFFMLIMTHNFDFYRTIQSRLYIKREHNCLMSVKTDTELKLVQAHYLHPFETWKKQLENDNKMLIASIPMVRNLIEYTEGQGGNYKILTSLLHQKSDTHSITLTKLAQIFNNTFSGLGLQLGTETVLSLLFSEADDCLDAPECINLENKVILSIAIRLVAEEIMIKRIDNKALTSNITGEQTAKLFDIFKKSFNTDTKAISILGRVVMMTPESIHLNSFMYEPLIDMSDLHLKELYKSVKNFPASIP